MLRCGKQIRLTPAELKTFQNLSGGNHTPKTIDAYNDALLAEAEYWEEDGSPEGLLMAAVARADLVDSEEKGIPSP